ncbi:MAG TPA: class I SAM-dependent methyltransferase [Candidatus Krumholzibacteria bacterium]|nr:class I SAM-dependent methyltransferase [Candidatus Krumholzibacteria bacterium]
MDEQFQAQLEAAAKFEEHFVPALFDQWSDIVTEAAHIQPGQRVLDVGCRTGYLAREARRKVEQSGQVVGVDASAAMLAVGSKIAPDVEFRMASPEALPFEDGTFDAVLNQFGLAYLTDRLAAVREMQRVLKSGGSLAVAAWDILENVPAYAILIALLQYLVGKRAADVLRLPFSLGDPEVLRRLFSEAGMTVEITPHQGTARHPSVRAWVLTDVKAWFPLVDVVLKKEEYDALIAEAEHALHAFVQPNGTVVFPITIHVASYLKP